MKSYMMTHDVNVAVEANNTLPIVKKFLEISFDIIIPLYNYDMLKTQGN